MWTGKLRKQYKTFDEFEAYSDVYNLASRLGFNSAAEAWKANPTIQGSTNPADYKIVPVGNEIIEGQAIRCYDNGGATADRYTVVFMNQPEREQNTFNCLGMSSEPFHPQGIGQHSSAMPGKHLGKRIPFAELPTDCQAAAMQDLKPWFTTSSGRIELQMTLEQAKSASHQGQCDDDVKALSKVPAIASQLENIDAELLREELREYGAWSAEELADHDENLQRLVWLAACDINENSKGSI